jgi:2'-5' RNA ligase
VTDRPLRTFVAIELPEDARAALAAAQTELRAALGERGTSIRWTDAVGAHLTLKFLGDTAEVAVAGVEAALHAALAATGPFVLRTGSIGCFPSGRSPRVIWLGLDGDLDRLTAARDAVEEAIAPLGWPTEARPFSPHLTLGRVRPDASLAERVGIGKTCGTIWPPPATSIPVSGVSLMRSDPGPQGARYTRLVHVPLTG